MSHKLSGDCDRGCQASSQEKSFLARYGTLILLGIVGYGFLVVRYFRAARRKKQLKILAEKSGCQPAPFMPNRWPLGLDVLRTIIHADGEGHLMETFLGFHRKMGWTFSNKLLGAQSWGTVEPRNVETMQSTHFEDWGMGPRRPIMLPTFGDGIFVQEGAAWKHSREVLRPQFGHSQYDDMGIFEEAVEDLFMALGREVETEDGVVDLQPLFYKLTLDTTTAFLFGESVKSLLDTEEEKSGGVGEENFAQAFNTAQIFIQQRFRLGDFYWLSGGRKFREACKSINDFADQLIERGLGREKKEIAKEGEKGKYVFLDTVAQKVGSKDELRGQAINILAAGRDTTAALLSWVFFLLVRHPTVLDKLRQEIQQHNQDGHTITRSLLRNMSYLQNILKETLRLYPSVPLNTRTALRDTVLPTGGGAFGTSPIFIPKGGNVAFSVYTMHRRPDLYGLDAELFRPERWDDPELPIKKDKGLERWGYLPFNGGPRVCLGMDFALVEAGYTIVQLLQRYPIIELAEGEKIEIVGSEKQLLTLILQIGGGGVRVKLGR